jgi:hypothetical protein
MRGAQRHAYSLTVTPRSDFTDLHMQRQLVVLLTGVVLIERAYIRSGG